MPETGVSGINPLSFSVVQTAAAVGAAAVIRSSDPGIAIRTGAEAVGLLLYLFRRLPGQRLHDFISHIHIFHVKFVQLRIIFSGIRIQTVLGIYLHRVRIEGKAQVLQERMVENKRYSRTESWMRFQLFENFE